MCLHAKLPLIEVKKTVFDDALALEMTVGKVGAYSQPCNAKVARCIPEVRTE